MGHSVFIVDDHPVIRKALAALLEAEPDLVVRGLAGSAEEALGAIPPGTPDLVLIDVSMPGMGGIALVACLLAEHPNLRTLMVSGHAQPHYAQEALDAGARGYVLKDDPDMIIEAVRTVLRGEVYLSEPMHRQLGR